MDTLRAAVDYYWEDECFWLVGFGTTVVAAVSFWTFSIPFTVLAVRQPKWAERWRVQPAKVPSPAELRGMILGSTRCFFINYATSLAMVTAVWPLLKNCGIHIGERPGLPVCLLQFCACVMIEDFLFYWTHRLLHHPRLYRHIHKQHHHYTAPIAICGAYMHPLEQQIIVGGILAGPVLIALVWGLQYQVLWAWLFFRNWETAEEHSGFDLPFLPSRLLPLYDGPAYHDFHHKVFDGNYAAVTCLWDRLFGTVAAGYDEYLAGHGQKLRGASVAKAE
eukprot:TRINITY_DN15286_c0_g1_i1.p1 TRINITY_DN15286_c0_g1~~TRINITY_DN15286_c0_g1_i1.p1  ORF type:complete len:306 (+),score=114.05 TRINITY_DN15286_c0_g1_i1:89-919(+)